MPAFSDIPFCIMRMPEGEKTFPDGRNGGQEDEEAVLQEEYGDGPEGHGRGAENPGDPAAGGGPAVRGGAHGGADCGLLHGPAAGGDRGDVLGLNRKHKNKGSPAGCLCCVRKRERVTAPLPGGEPGKASDWKNRQSGRTSPASPRLYRVPRRMYNRHRSYRIQKNRSTGHMIIR